MLMPSIFGESLLDDFFDFPFENSYRSGRSQLMRTDIKDTDQGYEVTMNPVSYTHLWPINQAAAAHQDAGGYIAEDRFRQISQKRAKQKQPDQFVKAAAFGEYCLPVLPGWGKDV